MDTKKLSILGQLGIGGGMGGVLSGITGGNPMMGAIGSIITGGNSTDAKIQSEQSPIQKMPVRDRSELLIGGGWIRPSGSGPMTDAEYMEGRRLIDSMPTGPAKELRQIRLFQQFLRSTV
tara:strand:- start:364 stop:723 length:360 start_codon:yes stop_codon:yes gene_type:complete